MAEPRQPDQAILTVVLGIDPSRSDTETSQQPEDKGVGSPEAPSRSWIKRFALAVIVANIAFVVYHLSSAAPTVPAFGDTMPSWSAVSLRGESIESHEFFAGHFGLLLYAEGVPSRPIVRYLEVLLDRYHDHEAGLRVVLALGPAHLERSTAEQIALGVTYPIIYDSNSELSGALRIAPHTDHSLLIGTDGRLVLSVYGLPKRNELRQHVEKHLLGEIHYAASPVSLLGPEAKLPPYEVLEVNAGTQSRLVRRYAPLPGTQVVVLPALVCAICDPAALHGRIVALHEELCSPKTQDCLFEILVTAGYPTSDLIWQIAIRGLGEVPIYQATGSLSGLEDEYFVQNRGELGTVAVLHMGVNQRVISISKLREGEETNHVH